MARRLLPLLVVLLAAGLAGCGDSDRGSASCAPDDGRSIAREWNEAVLDAIRRDYPAPTVHARNLYHLSAAMWDAWTAYDDPGSGLFHDVAQRAPDGIDAARHEAISHAAYTLMRRRYAVARGGAESIAQFDSLMERHCYSTEPATDPESPAAVGRLIAGTIIDATIDDGSREPFGYLDNDYEAVNPPLAFDDAGTELTDPNRWQPLEFALAVPQYGLDVDGGVQTFTTPQWGSVTPFAIDGPAGLPLDPGEPPRLGDPATDARFKAEVIEVIDASASLDPDSGETVDLSPDGDGANVVPLGDWARAIAEFWADGPDSETPPGHWNTLANAVTDHPQLERRIGGTGPELDALEWDVRLYLALNGALHDAAIAAWAPRRPMTAAARSR